MRRRAYWASVLFFVAASSYWLVHVSTHFRSSVRKSPQEVVAEVTGLPLLAGVYEV